MYFRRLISLFIFLVSNPVSMSNPCVFYLKMYRFLYNEGFHRNLTFTLKFFNEHDEIHNGFNECSILVEQILPAGIFVNPDELMDLRRMNKVFANTKSPVNVELPTEKSETITLLVYGNVTDSEVSVWVPVHARYHSPVAGGGQSEHKLITLSPKQKIIPPDHLGFRGTARNIIPQAKIHLRCPDDDRLQFCNSHSQSNLKHTDWRQIDYTQMTPTPVWAVPVGDLHHYKMVVTCTTIVMTIGTLYIIKSILGVKIVINLY